MELPHARTKPAATSVNVALKTATILLLCLLWALPVSAQDGATEADSFGGWPAGASEAEGDAVGEAAGSESPAYGFGGGFSAYGYVKSTARLGFGHFSDLLPQDGGFINGKSQSGGGSRDDAYSSGALTVLRLKADWEPEELVSAHVELEFETSRGYLNPYGFQEASGLDALTEASGGTAPADLQGQNPQDDFHSELMIDHAWALFSTGPLDLKLGKMPVAWGTAYAFNPIDRVNSDEEWGGSEGEETPGSTGLMPSLQVGGPFSLTSYLLYEEKTRSAPAGEAEGNPDNYPFGIKLQGYGGRTDYSLAFVKEVTYLGPSGSAIGDTENEYRRWYYLGSELFTSVGDGGLYAEAVCRLPGNNGSIDFDDEYELTELFEAAAGGEYTLEGGTTLRAEYCYHGRGEVEKSEYRVAGLLSGELPMLGRDYLFARVSHTFFDYLELSLAGLGNLNDRSFVVLPEASYSLKTNVQLTASGVLPYGPKGSELHGRFDLLPGTVPPVDLVRGGLHFEVKVSF